MRTVALALVGLALAAVLGLAGYAVARDTFALPATSLPAGTGLAPPARQAAPPTTTTTPTTTQTPTTTGEDEGDDDGSGRGRGRGRGGDGSSGSGGNSGPGGGDD